MNTRILSSFLVLISCAVLGARTTSAAVVSVPGYTVRTIPTPNTVQGGVVRGRDRADRVARHRHNRR